MVIHNIKNKHHNDRTTIQNSNSENRFVFLDEVLLTLNFLITNYIRIRSEKAYIKRK